MTLSSELQYLADMYESLRRKLFDCGGASTHSAADPVLASEELMSRVGQLEGRVSQLAHNWQELRTAIDTNRRAQIEAQAASVSALARQLEQVCGAHAHRLDHALQQISRELGELERGARYLASIRPVKSNYPKFVDSTG